MKCQIYEIINGETRYIYNGVRGLRFSKCRVSTFTVKEAREIVNKHSHHKLIIATPTNMHFRETDENGLILKVRKTA